MSSIIKYSRLYDAHNESGYYQSNSRRSNEISTIASAINATRIGTLENNDNDNTISFHNDTTYVYDNYGDDECFDQ